MIKIEMSWSAIINVYCVKYYMIKLEKINAIAVIRKSNKKDKANEKLI